MFVAASTSCFESLPLSEVLERLSGLEFTRVEVEISEQGNQLKPSMLMNDLDGAIRMCRETQRLDPVAYSIDLEGEGDSYYEQFHAVCRLAKATKVFTITGSAGELGTPFNAEIERLREMVRIATLEGVLFSIKTEIGRITENPDTAVVLCDNVKGLGISLDPSHYICGPFAGANYENLLGHVYHVRLRDTSKERIQVQIGQGEVEYGRLVTLLAKHKYRRALCVDVREARRHQRRNPQWANPLKIRLLLESLL